MEFAGKDYIYLSKLKKDKIKKIQKSEEDNKDEAPVIKEDEKEDIKDDDEKDEKLNKYSNKNENLKNLNDDLALSDDNNLSVNSCEFNKDFEKSDSDNENEAPLKNIEKKGNIFKKEIDTNVCVIRHKELENESEIKVPKLYQCKKCQSYLNKYSKLIPTKNTNEYEWKCEFCLELNKNLIINKNDIPLKECFEKCIETPIEKNKNTKENDDSSLIFCFDISGSMCQSYYVERQLKKKFNEITGKKQKKKKFNIKFDDEEEDLEYDFENENKNYISRLELVKMSIESNINSLLKNSPNVKVGIVTFGSEIEVKGDCLSNIMIIKEKDMNNEKKIISLGEENTNLIKSPIKASSSKIIQSLYEIEENGATALGPAVLLSLSLLKNSKIGSRIFLCTDGMSNLGVGDISQDREKAKTYYSKIGEMAKQKGIVINLITFEDSESEIEILMNMIQISGGEIIRVNPNVILDGFNDLLENEAIASEVQVRMNLNKSMTFRDKENKDMINDGASIIEKIGNATKETETYFELKFKKALKLAEMKDINFDELKNLTFQCEIIFKKKNGGKYIRVISKNLKISDNKEEIESQANFDIITTMEIQKSAKLAKEGLFREAQAQAHIARKYLKNNIIKNQNCCDNYVMFNRNMNSFNEDLEYLNNEEKLNNYEPLEKKEKKEKKFKASDKLNVQIHSLSNTSQNRQKNMFNKGKKKK